LVFNSPYLLVDVVNDDKQCSDALHYDIVPSHLNMDPLFELMETNGPHNRDSSVDFENLFKMTLFGPFRCPFRFMFHFKPDL